MKNEETIVFNNNYNRRSYIIGTRITRAHIPRRIGYLDRKTKIFIPNINLEYLEWVKLVNETRVKLKTSTKNAANYINNLLNVKLKQKNNYQYHFELLKNNCGKLFSVVPS